MVGQRYLGRQITSLVCGGCRQKVESKMAMDMYLKKHMPDAGWKVKDALSTYNWGTRKQVGIYEPSATSAPNQQMIRLLNNGKVPCPRCDLVQWTMP